MLHMTADMKSWKKAAREKRGSSKEKKGDRMLKKMIAEVEFQVILCCKTRWEDSIECIELC